MNELVLRHCQRARRVNLPLLRQLTLALLRDGCGIQHYELGLHLVSATKMARLNQRHLNHSGSTDVITFDWKSPQAGGAATGEVDPREPNRLHGDIFISLDDALKHARRFRTTWQSELARYVVHGVLHLLGHDDSTPAGRKRMKREEDRRLRALRARFDLGKLALRAQRRSPRPRPAR